MRKSSFRRRAAVITALALALGASPTLAAAATPSATPVTGQPTHSSKAERYADHLLQTMTLEEKIGQLFILFAYGPTADGEDARNMNLYGESNAADIIEAYEPGGFILFSARDNVTDPVQVATLANSLQDAAADARAGIPLLVSTDQEQGIVTRIGSPATLFPGNMALGAGGSEKDTRRAAAIVGDELLAMGIQQNNAPVADVNVNPANPVIGVRSFSSDTDLVSRLTAATVKGFQDDSDLVATAKHFPGHGDTATDSHPGLPVISHTL